MDINHIIYIVSEVFQYLFLLYAFLVISSYILLAIFSTKEMIMYLKKNSFVNYSDILSSKIAPSISIIAPAYNESLNIVANVRSLLSAHYVNYDVIIVNDGSKDDSLEKLIETYQLVEVDYLINERIKTQKLRAGVFKSTNPAFEKLIVVDKENGGKADALNLGLNISNNDYVACIDVDCLLLEDSLQKMIKPFLEYTDRKVIASGGVIRIANSCVIENGKLMEVNFPNKMIERMQILEYFRAFLLGRMAWSRLNGLLVISGAFGMFDKEIAIKVGGYDVNTVGEDMEIVVRMRRHMEENKEKYKVAYIPDPLCWTEAPDNYKIFISQRNRWTRGTIETLKEHKVIGFNRKYGVLGMLSFPYWFFFERMAPIIEVLGIIYFILLLIFRDIRWDFALSFFLAAYLSSIIFTVFAIFSEELTYHQYKKKGTGKKLIITAFLEPLLLHPFSLYAAIKGNFDYYFNKNIKWGAMTRKGLSKK
ncbi:Poly-beta-1,6-N-acetyl-D-glucosamine synthase [Polaribacter huanghezhanensis]|uniref:glycosyltransferase family 2 protein n=1 Tax=Polaribacter huanghezhanensis TaxID=1354726 RepID=UPI0026473DBF|nr:glycosyltransferase [Polaribacter huanghezhanensis]WKD86193.1 Poly-beta-1,6-N-acetyl-D-glucosamine synthase [Polaribacter huanghezhanensis]